MRQCHLLIQQVLEYLNTMRITASLNFVLQLHLSHSSIGSSLGHEVSLILRNKRPSFPLSPRPAILNWCIHKNHWRGCWTQIPEFLIEYFWGEGWEVASLINFQVILTMLVFMWSGRRAYFENYSPNNKTQVHCLATSCSKIYKYRLYLSWVSLSQSVAVGDWVVSFISRVSIRKFNIEFISDTGNVLYPYLLTFMSQ